MRELRVELHGDHAGDLVQDDSGRVSFRYAEAWLARGDRTPVSCSLPLGTEVHDHRAAEPFFGGLLPEESVRERIARFLGITARNDFAMLAEIGGECAGAVRLVAGGDGTEPSPNAAGPGLRVLDDGELEQLLVELPRRPLLMAAREARLSLAGAQDKVAVTLTPDGRVALPTDGSPTSHILKAPIPGIEGTVANEAVCLDAARRLGLDVASAARRRAGSVPYLLVERYDRIAGPDGATLRLHQEDVCQALGVPTRLKYQSEGGPGLSETFALLTRVVTRPALARLALLRATIFNVAVGNADAHAKNFSLLHGNARFGRPGTQLAPLYDLLSTLAYPDLSPRFAMKIGTARTFAELSRGAWEAMAEGAGLAPAQVRREVRSLGGAIPGAVEEAIGNALREGTDPDEAALLDHVASETRARCEIMVQQA